MKWTAGSRDNVEDVRARSGGGMRMGGLGIGGLLLVLILSWATGVDFLSLLGPDATSTSPSASTSTGGELRTTPEEEKLVDFVDAVMKDAQEMWQAKLAGRYQPTRAVIFRDAIQSACGSAQSATGPFYCPADQLVYLDLGFFGELPRPVRGARRLRSGVRPRPRAWSPRAAAPRHRLAGAPPAAGASRSGEPAVGEARAAGRLFRRRLGPSGGPAWPRGAAEGGARERGHRGRAERRRRRSATTAFSACPASRVAPDRFTHGSSEQRVSWFRRGFERGDMEACETFQ